MPIHHTKLTIAKPHITGWFNPHTPTPVDSKYNTQRKQTVINVTLMAKLIFHQRGVGPSATPAMVSESQPMPRRLATNGSRSNSTGGACTTSGASCAGARISAASAISALLSRPAPPLPGRAGP